LKLLINIGIPAEFYGLIECLKHSKEKKFSCKVEVKRLSSEQNMKPPIRVRSTLLISFLLSAIFAIVDARITLSDPNFFSSYSVFDSVLEWFAVGLVLTSLILGASAFFYTFGATGSAKKLTLGMFLLGAEALVVLRPIQFTPLSELAHAGLFFVLGLIAVLAYRSEGLASSAIAGLSVVAVGVLQATGGPPYDPIYNLIYGVTFIIKGATAYLATEIAIASVGNLAISILWGFLVGDIFFGNWEVGKFYSEKKLPTKLFFFVLQVILVFYAFQLFYNTHSFTSRILEGDKIYLALDALSLVFLFWFWIAKMSKRPMLSKLEILRTGFIVVGTTFLIPTLYPALDLLLRLVSAVPLFSKPAS